MICWGRFFLPFVSGSDVGFAGFHEKLYWAWANTSAPAAYPRENFTFSSQFIRLSMPHTESVSTQLRPESIQGRVLQALPGQPLSKSELAKAIGQKSISGKLNARVRALLEEGMIESQPDVHALLRRRLSGCGNCPAGCWTIAPGPQPGIAGQAEAARTCPTGHLAALHSPKPGISA